MYIYVYIYIKCMETPIYITMTYVRMYCNSFPIVFRK